MKTRAIALVLLGILVIIIYMRCSRFREEQQVLNHFVASLRKGDCSAALSYCYGAEHIKLKSGENIIYFQAIVPTGKTPAFLGGPFEFDAYPGSISCGGIDSTYSWAITGAAKGVNIQEVAPRAPSGCYVLETRAYGLVGFVRIDKQPKICFITFTHG